MALDALLVEAIKKTFAEYSAAQLLKIVQTEDHERWSPEALVAATELLRDRTGGRAEEPPIPNDLPPPPPVSVDPYSLGFIALGALGVLGGFGVFPVYRPDYTGGIDPDLPVPFGSRIAWLALDTNDTDAVATALGMRAPRRTNWADGIAAAYQASVFVTPPLGDWTLAVGTPLFPPDRAEAFVKPLLERLSRQFGEAQYFGTHRDVEMHIWARARKGRLIRGHGWLGQKALTLWDEGSPTDEEQELVGSDEDTESSEPVQAETGGQKPSIQPNEEYVMQLASLWSIDPMTLDEEFKEPVLGLLDTIPQTKPQGNG